MFVFYTYLPHHELETVKIVIINIIIILHIFLLPKSG